ncbi:MAG: MFS transporter [Rubrobacteraceae bacterium]
MINEQDRKWWVTFAMGLILVLINVDLSALTIALPAIGRGLDTSNANLQWVMNAYILALAAPSVAAGRLADIFGRRKAVLVGTVVFAVGSVFAGFALADWWLIAARVVQGLGAATFFTASLSVVTNAFPQDEQSKGIGLWAAIGGIGLSLGPMIGGFLTDVLSWRWLFFANIPIALITILLTLAAARESRDDTAGRHIDLIGLLSVTGGLVALVFAIQQSSVYGWGSAPVLWSLVVAVILLGIFFLVEPRLHEPLIELGLFANRGYLGANALAATGNFGFGALLFLLTLYLQNVLGYSPLGAGFVFLAYTVTVVVFELISGPATSAVGFVLPLAGAMVLLAVGFFMLALITPSSGLIIVIVAIAIAGAGIGVNYTLATSSGMSSVPQDKAGAASGILSMVRLVGTAFGIAVAGTLFKTLENNKLSQLLRNAGTDLSTSERREIRGLLSGSDAAQTELARLAPEAADQLERIVREAFVYGFGWAMALCAVVSLVGVLAAFLVPARAS